MKSLVSTDGEGFQAVVSGARAQLCVLKPKSAASPNPFQVLDEDDDGELTRAGMEFLAHSDSLTIPEARGMRAQRKR